MNEYLPVLCGSLNLVYKTGQWNRVGRGKTGKGKGNGIAKGKAALICRLDGGGEALGPGQLQRPPVRLATRQGWKGWSEMESQISIFTRGRGQKQKNIQQRLFPCGLPP